MRETTTPGWPPGAVIDLHARNRSTSVAVDGPMSTRAATDTFDRDDWWNPDGALIGLLLAFAFWWTYFDFAGRRLPIADRLHYPAWQFSHLPLTMAIAATGAALTAVIAETNEGQIEVGTAWLLSGAAATMLVSIVITIYTLQDRECLIDIYQPLAFALVVGAF